MASAVDMSIQLLTGETGRKILSVVNSPIMKAYCVVLKNQGFLKYCKAGALQVGSMNGK